MKHAAYIVTEEVNEMYTYTDKVIVECEETPIQTMLKLLLSRTGLPVYKDVVNEYVGNIWEPISDKTIEDLYSLVLLFILNPTVEELTTSRHAEWLQGLKEVTEEYLLYYGKDVSYEIVFSKYVNDDELAEYNKVNELWE